MHRIVLSFQIIFQKIKKYLHVRAFSGDKKNRILFSSYRRLPLVSIIFVQGAVEDIGGQLWRLVPL
jgi:hypothetical protein